MGSKCVKKPTTQNWEINSADLEKAKLKLKCKAPLPLKRNGHGLHKRRLATLIQSWTWRSWSLPSAMDCAVSFPV